jgi:hypothetical protein
VTTDAQGHFTLDAPLGRNSLQFDGQGGHGNLEVDVHQGKELHLAVELKGDNVNLKCEIEEPEETNNNGEHTAGGSGANACDQGAQSDDHKDDPADGANDEGEKDHESLSTTATK